MSRSFKRAYCYAGSCDSKRGKQVTSRRYRRGARKRLHMAKREWNGHETHPDDLTDTYQGGQDRFRGFNGRRAPDWGWDYFCDGLHRWRGFTRPRPRWDHPWEDPTNWFRWESYKEERENIGWRVNPARSPERLALRQLRRTFLAHRK